MQLDCRRRRPHHQLHGVMHSKERISVDEVFKYIDDSDTEDLGCEPVPTSEINKEVELFETTAEVMDPAATIKNRRNSFGYIKYVSLVVLTVQNAALGLSMRYSRTRDVEMFSPSAAVLMSEVMKLIICLGIVFYESGIEKGARVLYATVILNIVDTLHVCVPSVLYIIQNNLLYVSASNLDAATYQVTYQLKILTTAFFAVVVLKRKLLKTQWWSLLILAAGVALVQLASTEPAKTSPNLPPQSRVLGFSTALAACFISGFAGIYFEKILKGSDISVWIRNVQLSLLSIPFGFFAYLIQTGSISNVLFGFDGFVWYLVLLQAAGGLVVAVVVKYADNILKGFATSVAIIISCVASIYIFAFHLTLQFSLGTLLVIGSIFLYGYVPKKTDNRNINV